MKPISTEDDEMRKTYIAIFEIALIIMLANSFLATPSSILDTDPSTYIIVPIIMIPLFAVFLFKNRIKSDVQTKDIALGLVLFAAFMLSIFYLRYVFSFMFIEFRLDMLLFPLAIASIVVTVFGIKNINAFKALMIYALFASPILLTPIFSLNQGFASMNALMVYNIMHQLDRNATFVPPISIEENGYTIGIGESCAGIGALIGLIFFLIPVAYLFDGKAGNKVLWVFSGAFLFLLLNLLRMFGIGVAWLYYGPNASASLVHMFAGMLIFYIVIIVMLLIAGVFKLKVPRLEKAKTKKKAREGFKLITLLAVAYAILYYFVSLNYPLSFYVSPYLTFSRIPLNGTPFANFISSNVNATGYKEASYTINNSSDIILLVNGTFNTTSPLAMLITPPNKEAENALFSNSTVIAKETYLGGYGLNTNVYKIYSNHTSFFIIIKDQPYIYNNIYGVLAEYAIMPEIAGNLGIKCRYSLPYNFFYSLFNFGFYNSTTESELESAYCINERIFK